MSQKGKLMSVGQALEILNMVTTFIESKGSRKMYPQGVLSYLAGDDIVKQLWDTEDWPTQPGTVFEGDDEYNYDLPLDEDGSPETVDYLGYWRKTEHSSSCARQFRKQLESSLARARTLTKKHALPQRKKPVVGKVSTRDTSKKPT